jgi:hypothetical protein
MLSWLGSLEVAVGRLVLLVEEPVPLILDEGQRLVLAVLGILGVAGFAELSEELFAVRLLLLGEGDVGGAGGHHGNGDDDDDPGVPLHVFLPSVRDQ